ncbi:MAG: ParB/RepB/Spo0J family partition protein, partial [Candidatus Latescibacteria bacterium]|nr:ParB/RepB/Spo0J family partition protein [Candidatus Latescibacterota bacterium]
MQRKALGKGLEALFGPNATEQGTEEKTVSRSLIAVPINDIIPNRNQPRENFSIEAMEELKKSIEENGILEPPVVHRNGELFELIAGERRFRAAKELGFDSIDVIIMDVRSEQRTLVLSLIENIQREDLNAIEEARAYQQIMNTMNITQEKLSGIVGKSRSTVANTLRLLALSEDVQAMVSDGVLAPGSARALVTVEDKNLQLQLARNIASGGLSSRKAEELVGRALTQKPKKSTQIELSPFVEASRL